MGNHFVSYKLQLQSELLFVGIYGVEGCTEFTAACLLLYFAASVRVVGFGLVTSKDIFPVAPLNNA